MIKNVIINDLKSAVNTCYIHVGIIGTEKGN